MNKLTKSVHASQAGKISLVLVLTLSLITVTSGLMLGFPRISHGAALTSVKDTLQSSAPSAASNHTIVFTLATAIADDGSTITITFPSGFDTASVTEDEVDVSGSTTGEMTTAPDCSSTEEVGVAMASDILTLTICDGDGGDLASSETVTVEIGSNATSSGTGSAGNRIVNPSKSESEGTADTYSIDIGGTMSDSGTAMVAIIEGVDVSVTVDEALTFTVAAVASGSCDTGASDGTSVTTNLTGGINVPFGTVSTEAFYNGCLDLAVTTNATNGYTTTLEQDALLTDSSTSETIAEGNCDGGCSDTTSATWATATNNGFGYCLEDTTGDAAETADGTDWAAGGQCDDATPQFKTFPTTATTEDIMVSAGTTGGDTTRMLYRISVPGDQAAGTYENTVTYIATPTF